MMKAKILGVCGSPVKGGNTEVFLEEALKAAREIEGIETELISLAKKNINSCQHCNWCLKGQREGRYCQQQDDMLEIYPSIEEADGLLLSSPVYLGRLSGHLACFMDRFRAFVVGNYYGDKLKDKVGGALAISWWRDRGEEATLLSIEFTFLLVDMLIARGAAGVSSFNGTGKFDLDDRHLVMRDEYGLKSARRLGRRMAEIISMVKAGKEALREEHKP